MPTEQPAAVGTPTPTQPPAPTDAAMPAMQPEALPPTATPLPAPDWPAATPNAAAVSQPPTPTSVPTPTLMAVVAAGTWPSSEERPPAPAPPQRSQSSQQGADIPVVVLAVVGAIAVLSGIVGMGIMLAASRKGRN